MDRTKMTKTVAANGLTRRNVLTGAAALSLILALPAQMAYAANNEVAQTIADHFSSVKTMSGEFVQFGPRGEQTGGKFFIQRPGKIRFNYEAPSSTTVVSDGRSVVVE